MPDKNGIERIAAERKRQVEEEGWTTEHDAEHVDGSLAMAACHYVFPGARQITGLWPPSWACGWDKRGATNRIRDLEKAGALIAAEIDRLLAEENCDA